MRNLAILTLIMGVFVFASSCKKIAEPTSVDVVEAAGTATIHGIAYAQIIDTFETVNFTNPAEYAPSGTVIVVEINRNDFPGASTHGNVNNMLVYTTTVGANGAWTIDVKAPKTPISATIRPDDFYATYVTGSCATCSDPNTEFNAGTYNATIVEGNSTIVDVWY
jgi:hypothetical protein